MWDTVVYNETEKTTLSFHQLLEITETMQGENTDFLIMILIEHLVKLSLTTLYKYQNDKMTGKV